MTKRILSVLLTLAVVTTGAFASGAAEAAPAGEAQPVELSFSSQSVPGDAHTEAMNIFKQEVEERSGGQITVDVYHSGQLFTQEGEQTAIRRGTVDLVYTSPPWLSEFIPYMSMFAAAYTFNGYEHMRAVYDSEIGERLFADVVEEVGIRPLSAFYLGTRQLNLVESVGPVRTPQDMAGVKFRVPGSPSWIAMGRALGGDPTPLAFTEVYLGLQTGTVEGQDNPLPTDYNAKFYEVTKYIVLTDHVVDTVWPTINEAKWQSMTAQQQQWVLESLEVAKAYVDETNLANEARLAEYFESEGLIIIDDPDKEAFMEFARNSYLNDSPEISSSWDLDLYDQIGAMAP
jgi:tripartite ATP-independent transporter DctP family solute receptor